MNILQQKCNEISAAIEQFPACQVFLSNEEKQIYNVISTAGLTWKEQSNKWGKIFIGEERLRIDIDYPVGLFTEEELKEFTQLPLKTELAKKNSYSHINPTVGHRKYDTLRIVLYKDRLFQYDFSLPSFTTMLKIIVEHNVR